MNRKDRFKKRKMMLEKSKKTILVKESVDSELIQEFLTTEVDTQSVEKNLNCTEEHYDFKYDFSVSKEEAEDFLEHFKKDFNQEKFDKLVNDCKKEVIKSIATPFGVGKVFAAYDKVGGNVNTVHNAREGIYATEEVARQYEQKNEYDTYKYHSHEKYIEINRKNSKLKGDGKLYDYMTGDKIDSHERSDLDHVVSAKEIDDDAGRVLAGLDGANLANVDTNLKATHQTLNRSKKADTMNEFLVRKNKNLKEMEVLSTKGELSQQEQNRLRKLEELNKIDDKKAMQADKEARKQYNQKVNTAYHTSKEFAKNTARAGAQEGTKMGMQQALGLVLTEFFTAVFDEILDIYKKGFSHGFDNDKFFNVLKERLKRIALKIKEKWKDIAMAFKDGFISGFISNLVTTVINAFVTTGKRVVRVIREGIYSLFRAIKLLLFPPEDMTPEEAMHEAKKLIASGLIISLGIIAEEYVEKLIMSTGVLSPFADILATVFVGAITGLAVTMTVYYIDKKKNNKDMIKTFTTQTSEKFENVEMLLAQLRYNI